MKKKKGEGSDSSGHIGLCTTASIFGISDKDEAEKPITDIPGTSTDNNRTRCPAYESTLKFMFIHEMFS